MTVHIFQIGCQDIGRLGFEKFLNLERYFPVDLQMEGICCRDFEAEERASKFAESTGSNVTFFESVDDLYSAAQETEGEVLIYDAGPPHLHSRNITESLRHGFHHLTEKPPSITRNDHIGERKLAANSSVNYKVDFIERENPVVKKLGDLTSEKDIDKIEVFRESSFGVQKVLRPVEFSHVKGGCVLDKMSNDIYILDFLDSSELKFESSEIDYVMPKTLGGEKVLRTDGSGTRKVDENTAIGRCRGLLSSSGTDVELNASWLGLSDRARIHGQEVEQEFGEDIFREKHVEIDGKGFQDEECRFIVIEGEEKILGDLMHQRIYNLNTGDKIEVPQPPRDQLYRVFERAILDVTDVEPGKVEEEEIDEFMNVLFDIQERCDGDLFEEIDSATERIRSLMTSDKKVLDEADTLGVAR